MSAPELTPVERALHELLRRAVAGVVTEAQNSPLFTRLSEAEQIEVRKRLLTLSNLHTAIKRGERHPSSSLLELDRVRGWFPAYLRHLRGLFMDVTDHAMSACQVVSISGRYSLACEYVEDGHGGRKLVCEAAAGDQPWHEHAISEHTRLHDKMGDGHSCESIDAMLAGRINERKGAVR